MAEGFETLLKKKKNIHVTNFFSGGGLF